MAQRVFPTSGWYKVVVTISSLLIGAAGGYFLIWGTSRLHQAGGLLAVAFGIAAVVDVMLSRIVLDDDAIRIISLVRRRSYARTEFQSAKVDGGVVVLERRGGGWLKLPDTGANSLSVRNTVHAWIKAQHDGSRPDSTSIISSARRRSS